METTRRPTVDELLRQQTYRSEELADLLGMDLDIICHAVFTHELPARIVGHDIVAIRREDALRWLRERR